MKEFSHIDPQGKVSFQVTWLCPMNSSLDLVTTCFYGMDNIVHMHE